MRFRAFRVDWDTLFFSKIFVSAKHKTRASEASHLRACWSAWLYQSFIKNHSQLSYCSLEIVYAVKDCDSCGRAILLVYFKCIAELGGATGRMPVCACNWVGRPKFEIWLVPELIASLELTFRILHLIKTICAPIFTPPRSRGGVIFSLQFVCLCVCVCVCLSVCPFVNKMLIEPLHRFWCGLR